MFVPTDGFVRRNSHVKYQILISEYVAWVKDLNKQVKHNGQTHKVKSVGTHVKVLSKATFMRNITALVPTI
jgi:hypothetical protein